MVARESRDLNLSFDAERHRYFWRGQVIPSVTQVLEPLVDEYLERIPRATLEFKRALGQSVHEAIALDCADALDWASVDEHCAPFVAAWTRFRTEARITRDRIGSVERRRYHEILRFAGTPDLELLFERWSTVDLKCSFDLHPAVGPQTAGYQLLAEHEDGFIPRDRFALHLKPDGTYRLHPLKDSRDFDVFRSCLTVHNWKARYL